MTRNDRPCAIYYWALRDPSDPAGGCVYFGIAYDPDKRWRNHLTEARNGSQKPFHVAIRKHGPEAFERRAEWLPSRLVAERTEESWIDEARRRGIHTYNAHDRPHGRQFRSFGLDQIREVLRKIPVR